MDHRRDDDDDDDNNDDDDDDVWGRVQDFKPRDDDDGLQVPYCVTWIYCPRNGQLVGHESNNEAITEQRSPFNS